MDILVKNNYFYADGKTYQCAIGANGISSNKKEGDLKTQQELIILQKFSIEKIELVSLTCLSILKKLEKQMDGVMMLIVHLIISISDFLLKRVLKSYFETTIFTTLYV